MIKTLFDKLMKPIRDGNKYREEQNRGKNSWIKYTRPARNVDYPVFPSNKFMDDEKKALKHFEYLYQWTGARWVKAENPQFDEYIGKYGSIGYFDTTTGVWRSWNLFI